eukprot:1580782-Amphidinium_carterae.2
MRVGLREDIYHTDTRMGCETQTVDLAALYKTLHGPLLIDRETTPYSLKDMRGKTSGITTQDGRSPPEENKSSENPEGNREIGVTASSPRQSDQGVCVDPNSARAWEIGQASDRQNSTVSVFNFGVLSMIVRDAETRDGIGAKPFQVAGSSLLMKEQRYVCSTIATEQQIMSSTCDSRRIAA